MAIIEFIHTWPPTCIGIFCRSVSKVNDEWFANEEKVRAEVGLLEKPVVVVRQYEKEVNHLWLKCPFYILQ